MTNLRETEVPKTDGSADILFPMSAELCFEHLCCNCNFFNILLYTCDVYSTDYNIFPPGLTSFVCIPL